MNMRMTIIVFVVVATAATVVGSTPSEERPSLPINCCIMTSVACALYTCPTAPLECNDFCHLEVATGICGGDPVDGCCPEFMGCFMECLTDGSKSLFICFGLCKNCAYANLPGCGVTVG
uniref:Conotoxin unassigned superfamily 14 n=1 Tax=Conus ermineus TaxID=55423 RepID=A0A346CJF5_CONER|nr:conotoxin unassigned superfamily 14 [Conus ermineus]